MASLNGMSYAIFLIVAALQSFCFYGVQRDIEYTRTTCGYAIEVTSIKLRVRA